MKKVLKILKWFGITLFSLLLIIAIYLGITGFPKPPAISTENVPRLPFSYLSQISNASDDFSKYLQLVTWARGDDEGIYVKFASGLGLETGILDGSKGQPKAMEGWPSARPIFHPDPEKRFFLYTKDNSGGNERYQIYRFDMDTQESTMLSNGKDPHAWVRFIPESNKILYGKRRPDDIVYDLYTMTIDDPASERMVFKYTKDLNESGTLYIDDFSPDGDKVILRLGYYSPTPGVLNLITGQLDLLEMDTAITANYTYHQWSADGDKLYYASSKAADFSQLRVRHLKTGVDSVLIRNINWDVSNVSESPDGQWLVFNTNEDGTAKLNFHNIESGKTEQFHKLTEGNIRYSIFKTDANATIAFPLSYFSGETDIFSYNLETEELKQWTDNAQTSVYADPEVIKYPTFDMDTLSGRKREISALFVKPSDDFAPPYPVIIELHGGPNMQVRTEMNPFVSPNLSRGIAMIAPNFRGSSGYGFNFMNSDNGMGRDGAIKDVGALLDWIETQPELDANRVIVSGGSYGGFLSLACATQYSDRLLGAVDYFGMTDLITFLEGDDKNADRSTEFGDVNDPAMRSYLEQISPLNNVGNIDIPLFIFQGKKDARVLVGQSRKMVKALKEQNKEFWYVEAEDEGHGPNNPWNIVYIKTAEFTFVDKLFFGED